jgi:hypothetical protein
MSNNVKELDILEKENFSGYLGKASLKLKKASKERYFTIIGGQFLAYFKSKEQRLLKGIFDLDLITNLQPSKVLK